MNNFNHFYDTAEKREVISVIVKNEDSEIQRSLVSIKTRLNIDAETNLPDVDIISETRRKDLTQHTDPFLWLLNVLL